MRYRIFHNQTAMFWRPYEPGDVLVPGYEGDTGESVFPLALSLRDRARYEAEIVFRIHNMDDRPDGRTAPSLSVGDVVVFGEVALSVDRFGWKEVSLG